MSALSSVTRLFSVARLSGVLNLILKVCVEAQFQLVSLYFIPNVLICDCRIPFTEIIYYSEDTGQVINMMLQPQVGYL